MSDIWLAISFVFGFNFNIFSLTKKYCKSSFAAETGKNEDFREAYTENDSPSSLANKSNEIAVFFNVFDNKGKVLFVDMVIYD